jgi:hypothetical protein
MIFSEDRFPLFGIMLQVLATNGLATLPAQIETRAVILT